MARMKENLYRGPVSFSQMQFDYFSWLGNYICADQGQGSYWYLLEHLNEIPFRWSVPRDENRCEDGWRLRVIYSDNTGNLAVERDTNPCSVLEVLVALAIRMDDILSDRGEDRVAEMFWEMLNNLGLGKVTDEVYWEEGVRQEVDAILNIFLDRKYDRKGNGSPFPLTDKCKDQRIAELWYQMNAYLMEKYYVDM